ncbi:MAG: DUF115 domain-containing protein [Spartobacteria bacterium]|nr:DUF115 domain-containing protein [Spartobacteria bacterium]
MTGQDSQSIGENELIISVGEQGFADLAELRKQLPTQIPVIYLCMATDVTVPRNLPQNTRWITVDPMQQWRNQLVAAIGDYQRYKDLRLITPHVLSEQVKTLLPLMQQTIKQALSARSGNAVKSMTRLRCALQNLPLMFTNRSTRLVPRDHLCAIVCAAGPSLKEALPDIRHIHRSSQAVIIAVGHAVPTLMAADITPDIVVENDNRAGRHWQQDLRLPDSLLVTVPDVDSSVPARFRHILWSASSFMPINEMLNTLRIPLLPMTIGRTVSIHALDTAVRLGCSTIFMIGQDCSLAETGALYPGGQRPDDAEQHGLSKLPGYNGSAVYATHNLVDLWNALNQYMDFIPSVLPAEQRPVFYNASDRGALIAHTEYKPLRSHSFDTSLKHALFTTTYTEAYDNSALHQMLVNLRQYERIAGCLADLTDVADAPLDKDSEESVRAYLRAERDLFIKSPNHPLFTFIRQAAEQLYAPLPEWKDMQPVGIKRHLNQFYSFVHTLCEDVKKDVDRALTKVSPSPDRSAHSEYSPYIFSAFYHAGCRRIAQNNSDLAGILESISPENQPRSMRLRWEAQVFPYVEILQKDRSVALTDHPWDAPACAERDIRAFLAENQWDSARHGLIILEPVNWIHAAVMMQLQPQTSLLVVCHWLELLATQLYHGAPLHYLPEDTLIVATENRLPGWGLLFQQRLNLWRAENRIPLLFVPPRIRDIRDIRQLEQMIRRTISS